MIRQTMAAHSSSHPAQELSESSQNDAQSESMSSYTPTERRNILTGAIVLMIFATGGLAMYISDYNQAVHMDSFQDSSSHKHSSRRQIRRQTFALVSDIDDDTYPDIADILRPMHPDYLVLGGDINYAGDPPYIGVSSNFPAYAENKNIIFAFGNHDFESGIDAYANFFEISPGMSYGGIEVESKYYYTRITGEVQWFVLCSQGYYCGDDEKGMKEGGQQAAWLDRVLAESRANTDIKFRFVVNHWSPLSTLGYCCDGDCDYRLHWFPFVENGVDAIFSGHDHAYQRLSVPKSSDGEVSVNGHDYTLNGWEGLTMVVTGTGKNNPGRAEGSCSDHTGFSSYNKYDEDDDARGVIIATLSQYANGDALEFLYIATDGRVLDMFSVLNTGHLQNTWNHGEPVEP
ncbi:hypothetical protein SARC_05436 [Sphaeroforma arctica JP610]|uniref:Calcineurin-like phosphoesterase domain-containing protein n=1 Tax=Sphaeroforma arctica JP610 TaxID=667725 RepID=A0A0L0G0C0_9EUKA|nr:hypothetical protein SARC_05436 [Sphaeroforma arctica JP610]KNC82281.1 hypothetical protein SARC_05436 [Sphaeroforma arctica JP610]|eukprot:XP_014156183.1 hypothetical protein SARC_05436 [Sphaeroforma arctica JP610]